MASPDMCPICEHDWCQCSQRYVETGGHRPSPASSDPYEVFRRPTREVDMSEIRKRMMDTVRPPSLEVEK